MIKDYDIIAFDAQYFLFRNFAALKSRTGYSMPVTLPNSTESYVITKYEFDAETLVKHFYWSICKIIRDGFSCNKVILLWDYPPYHKLKFIPDFKGDRIHHCQDLLDDWDISSDPQGYLQECEEVKYESIKNQAKSIIIDVLNNLGMPSVISKGYEADDLAWIFSKSITNINNVNKCAICSVDSDWQYWISLNVDFINSNKYEVWTYQDVIDECDGYPTILNMDIFTTMQWMGSLFYSHNGLQRTTNRTWKQFCETVNEIKSGDYSSLIDLDRFNANMKSFEIWNYPEYDNTVKLITDTITPTSVHSGKLLSIDEAMQLLKKYNINISKSYYSTISSLLNKSYYN